MIAGWNEPHLGHSERGMPADYSALATPWRLWRGGSPSRGRLAQCQARRAPWQSGAVPRRAFHRSRRPDLSPLPIRRRGRPPWVTAKERFLGSSGWVTGAYENTPVPPREIKHRNGGGPGLPVPAQKGIALPEASTLTRWIDGTAVLRGPGFHRSYRRLQRSFSPMIWNSSS